MTVRCFGTAAPFDLNPFKDANTLGLNLNLRNTLFFNRGKQRYTTSYTYLANTTRNLIALGLQTNELKSHQLNFLHKVKEQYVLNFNSEIGTNSSNSENFEQRNYRLNTFSFNPEISYLFSDNSRVSAFYNFVEKANQTEGFENLNQQNFGFTGSFSNADKFSLNAGVKYIKNSFEGSAFSPVAYQMLEGLQPGTNFTWNVLAQKRITQFLDLNLSYQGRSSENTRTIHTGSVQLRAFF